MSGGSRYRKEYTRRFARERRINRERWEQERAEREQYSGKRSADPDAPRDWQLHDLAVLARRAGEPTPTPAHRGEAIRELARLEQRLRHQPTQADAD